jgi:hypothetical protein
MSIRETLEALRKLGPEKVLDGYELCPCCDSLSPGIGFRRGASGEIEEYIMHCPICHDKGFVTIEEADRGREEIRKQFGRNDL